MLFCSFFFSSRRRHTRFDCDWSSDVCSSDLPVGGGAGEGALLVAEQSRHRAVALQGRAIDLDEIARDLALEPLQFEDRSEERRVGKECRYRWSPTHDKKKKHETSAAANRPLN